MTLEIIGVLVIILIILLIIVLIKVMSNSNNNQKDEKIDELEDTLQLIANQLNLQGNQLNLQTDQITSELSRKNIEVQATLKNANETIDNRLANQNKEQMQIFQNALNTLDRKIAEQAQTTNTNVKEIVERVSRLDAVGKNIEGLNENINNLEKVLNDKKARGTFGEIRLQQIFQAVFGDKQKAIYEEQFQLSNGKRVDFMLHAPQPLGDVSIDSKFPLDNYNKIVNANNETELKQARSAFKQDIKKHINDIKNKYIIEGETAEQAIMFIPAESIFAEINGYHPEIVNYSYENNVWITSPTTLMGMLNLLLVVLKDVRRSEQSKEIYAELLKLKEEFNRYEERWSKFVQRFEMVNKDLQGITVTSQKINKRFNVIENVDFSKEKDDNN